MSPSLHRLTRRTLLPVTAALSLVLPPGVAHADPAGISYANGSIQSAQCSTWQRWEGRNYDDKASANYAPHGTVRHCAYRIRLKSSDRSAKYFVVYAESEYRFKDGKPSMSAQAWQYIHSSVQAASNLYDATDSYTSHSKCNDSFSVSLGVGPVGATVSPRVCDNYKVSRTFRTSTGAGFTAPKVGGVRRMGSAYVQKVPRRSKPVFTVTFYRPNFQHRHKGLYWVESGGYAKWQHTF